MPDYLPLKGADLNLDYANLRRLQATLVRYHAYFSGDLFRPYGSGPVTRYGEHLANTFFPATEGLAIREDIVRLFRAFLVMAPKLQQLKSRLDWHEGHVLTWIRRTANRNACRWCLGEKALEREHDPEQFTANLRLAGFKDDPFNLDVIDLFKRYYTAPGRKGNLANRLFDPVMFLSFPLQGRSVRIGNLVFRAEKEPFEGSQNIREGALIGGVHLHYRIITLKGKTVGRIDITIPQEKISGIKTTISRVIGRKGDPVDKVREIERIVGQFVQDARFAKSAYFQINDLADWLRQKLKPLVSPSYKKAAAIPDQLRDNWKVRAEESDIFWVNHSNFFWDSNHVEERVYRHFFSPYQLGS